MVEARSRAARFRSRVIWFVVLAVLGVPFIYAGMFVTTSTGMGATAAQQERYGTGVVQRCEPDGPLGMRFWHSCEVRAQWADGDVEQVVIPPPDLGPERVGDTVPIVFQDEGSSKNFSVNVRVDRSRPWAWVGWIVGLPLLFTGVMLFVGAVIALTGFGSGPRRTRSRWPRARPRGT